jgi:hypothetical protein
VGSRQGCLKLLQLLLVATGCSKLFLALGEFEREILDTHLGIAEPAASVLSRLGQLLTLLLRVPDSLLELDVHLALGLVQRLLVHQVELKEAYVLRVGFSEAAQSVLKIVGAVLRLVASKVEPLAELVALLAKSQQKSDRIGRGRQGERHAAGTERGRRGGNGARQRSLLDRNRSRRRVGRELMLKRVLGVGKTVLGVVEFGPQAILLVFGVRNSSEETVALLDMRLLDIRRLRLFFTQLPRERVGVRLRLGQNLAKRIGFERPAVVQLEELVVLVRLRLPLGRILQRALGEVLVLSSQVVQLVRHSFELFLRELKRVFELVNLRQSRLILLVLPDEVLDACLTRSELGLELEELTFCVHQGFLYRC